MPTSKSVQLVHPRKEKEEIRTFGKKKKKKKKIEHTMKQLQYSANAHGLCHNVFKL